MANQFKVGDVVKLRSGGPAMTVTSAGEDGLGRFRIWCSWFVNNEEKQGNFPPDALQLTAA